jgi:hypothetical protein
VKSRSHGRKRAFYYGCSSFHQRGRTVCRYGFEVPMALAVKAVVMAFRRLLTPTVVERVLDDAVRALVPSGEDGEAKRAELL